MYFELEESEKEAMEQKLMAAKAQLEQEMSQLKEQHQALALRQGERRPLNLVGASLTPPSFSVLPPPPPPPPLPSRDFAAPAGANEVV